MDSFDIDKLFERAAAEIRQPARAPCESLQCRAWHMSLMKWRRCTNSAEQHDGTCWAHADYYTHWWRRHVPSNNHEEDTLMYDNLEEMTFQLERGYVSLKDIEIGAFNPQCDLFFLWLCSFPDFDADKYPAHLNVATYKQTRHIILHQHQYDAAFMELHRYFSRGKIFHLYLIHAVHWIKNNFQGVDGPGLVLDSILRVANVTFWDIAGQRQLLASVLNQFRSSYIKNEAEDDCYNICKGRFWAWVTDLKMGARAAYATLKEELIAAAWAPERLPFWCLDCEEIAEEHPDGLPTKEAWAALCTAVEAKC